MKPIIVIPIKYKDQRYPSLDDFVEMDEDILNSYDEFRIAYDNSTGEKIPEEEQFLTLVHAIVEAYLCKFKGIKWTDIDNFDIELDKTHPDLDPGSQKNAPYHRQHEIAMVIEHILAIELGVNWKKYNG